MNEEKDCLEHYEEMCRTFPDYPCAKCRDPYCEKTCSVWKEWFCDKWELIRHNANELKERESKDD